MATGAAAAALLHPAALSAVAGSARRLLALAGALCPGADVGVLSRAMEELERMAGGTATDRVELSASASTAADMDIDSGGSKRKRDAPGIFQRPAKRRILAWRARRYRSLVAKARATARRARSRRARAQPTRRKTRGWKSVEQQLARATLSDGLHRWSPGGGGGPAEH
ncbi:unnamed protein product [Alopecurus aequalis]